MLAHEHSVPTTGRMIARLARSGRACNILLWVREGQVAAQVRCLSCGIRARNPGQMVRIDHTGIAVDTGFSVKEFKAVCPARSFAKCASRFLDHPVRQVPFVIGPMQVDGRVETACLRRRSLRVPPVLRRRAGHRRVRAKLARFEPLCNTCRPHQASGQMTAHADA